MPTLIITDLTDDELFHLREALDTSGRDYTSTAPVWTVEEATSLLQGLAPKQRAFIETLVVWDGVVPADEVRKSESSESLRGITGPITKAVNRLQKAGIIRGGLPGLVSPVYNPATVGFQKVRAYRLDEATVAAFREALAQP